MYSEKIDNINEQLALINGELRELAGRIIKDIFAIDPDKTKHTINVAYYTESKINGYDFLGIDGNGYGSALFITDITDIEVSNEKPWFNMVDEDGDSYEERNLNDFDTTELTYVVTMLNDILDVVQTEGKVNTEMDWDDYLA